MRLRHSPTMIAQQYSSRHHTVCQCWSVSDSQISPRRWGRRARVLVTQPMAIFRQRFGFKALFAKRGIPEEGGGYGL
jgi:hypothetical protein